MNNKLSKTAAKSKPTISSRQDLKARLLNSSLPGKRVGSVGQPGTNSIKRAKLDVRGNAFVVGQAAGTSSSAGTSGTTVLAGTSSTSASTVANLLNTDTSWMEFAVDIEVPTAHVFETTFTQLKEKNKPNRMARTICAAIKTIVSAQDPSNTHKDYINCVLTTIREEERLTKSVYVFIALVAMLNKVNAQQATLQINTLISLITQMCQSLESLPLAAVNYMLNDSLSARNWVDKPNASYFLQCMCSLFGNLSFPSEQAYATCELVFIPREPLEVEAHFNKTEEEISNTINGIRQYFERRSSTEPTKNLLRSLALCTGNSKFRLWAAKHLDGWLQNGKLQRQAMELLLYVAANIHDSFLEENIETLLCLVSMRALRSKQIMNVFYLAIKDIMAHCPGACSVLITAIMENEFSSMKFQHNMNVFHVIYNINVSESSEIIAKNLIKRLENPDAVKSVRTFLRDFVRTVIRSDFSFGVLSKAMFSVFRNTISQISQHLQDMLYRAFVDVVVILPFISITPLVKESVQAKSKTSNSSTGILGSSAVVTQPQMSSTNTSAQIVVGTAQADSVTKFNAQLNSHLLMALDFLKWAGRLIAVNSSYYLKSYYVLLYLGNYTFYNGVESWPSESDFNQYMKVIAECLVEENFLNDLMDVGAHIPNIQSHNVSSVDVIAMLEALTRRCLSIRGFESESYPLLLVKSTQTVDKLLRLSICCAEETLYKKQLATRSLYWRVWSLLVIWACLNRTTILNSLYERMPTLRMSLLIAITKDYEFPLPGLDERNASQIAQDDENVLIIERKIFKELNATDAFVSCLDDNNSNLSLSYGGANGGVGGSLSAGSPAKLNMKKFANAAAGDAAAKPASAGTTPPICIFDPSGVARRPLSMFLDNLRYCNEQYSLHGVLCMMRSPDILRQLLKDQGAMRTIPAVTQMVLKNVLLCESAIPLPCLCQLMILIMQQNHDLKSQFQQVLSHPPNFTLDVQNSITTRLKSNLWFATEADSVRTVLMFMLEKLASPIFDEREAAIHLLRELLKPELNEELELIDDDDRMNSSPSITDEDDVSLSTSPLYRLPTICFFSKLKNEICETLGQCCIIENNAQHLLHYINFISKHARNSILNRIASNLSTLVKRTSDNSEEHKRIRDCLMDFYARYIRKFEPTASNPAVGRRLSTSSVLSEEEPWDSDLPMNIYQTGLLRVSILEPRMEFEIDAQIVSAIMELLSEAFCDDNSEKVSTDKNVAGSSEINSREYLTKIFFPTKDFARKQLTVTHATDRNRIVDILPTHLKMKMLSSRDERIVKVALDGVDAEQAMEFLQSFALSSFSCSQLLSIINTSTIGRGQNALSAIPFVRAYKLKGAQGCDEFLSNLDPFIRKVKSKESKISERKSSKLLTKIFKVQHKDGKVTEFAEENRNFSTPSFVTEYLNELLKNASNDNAGFILDNEIISSSSFRKFLTALEMQTSALDGKSANESVQYAKAVVTFLGQKFQVFVEKLPSTLSTILVMLVDICAKNNNIRFLLSNLAERAERICPDAQFASSLLYRFHSKHGGASSLISHAIPSATQKRKAAATSAKLSTAEASALLFKNDNGLAEDSDESIIEKISKYFIDGRLSELQVENLLEKYCALYPQFFQFLYVVNTASSTDKNVAILNDVSNFYREVTSLFASNCAPLVDLISQITIYSSIPTIRRVTEILLGNFIPNVKPLLVIEFVENAALTNVKRCRYFPSATQCATLIEYVLAEFVDNSSYADFFFNNPTIDKNSKEAYNNAFSREKNAVVGKFLKMGERSAVVDDAVVSQPAANHSQDGGNKFVGETPAVIEQFLRILVAILEPNGHLETCVENDRRIIESIQSKILAMLERFRGRLADAENRKRFQAVELIMRSIERRFPGFSWNDRSKIAHILPPALCVNATPGGHFGVTSSLFIGSRRQLLRPIELLSVADFDDILHRTITDLYQLIVESSAIGGYFTPNGQSKLRSPTGELTIAVMANLIAEMKAKPYVMARQIPLLSIFVSAVLQRNFRQFRDAPFLTRFLEFALDVLLGTGTDSFNDTPSLEFLLQCFLRFFENFVKPPRNWADILEKCALILLKYTEFKPNEAAKFLILHVTDVRFLAKRCTERRPAEMGRLMEFLSSAEHTERLTER